MLCVIFIVQETVNCVSSFFTRENEDLTTLRHVTVIFRHGERTPDEMWPTFEYTDELYHSFGSGELTNEGKNKMFNIGTNLRKKYKNFLGDTVSNDTVYAMSTDCNRTKNSLNYLLAGIFPPKKEQIWNNRLQWQSFPYNFLPVNQDKCFYASSCQKFGEIMHDYVQTEKYQKTMAFYEKTFAYIEKFSGLKMNLVNMIKLYTDIELLHILNISVPEWTKEIYPDIAKALSTTAMKMFSDSDEKLVYCSGYLMQHVLDDMEDIINLNNFERKMNLYAGHDINIAFMLRMLDCFDDEPPTYGSHIVFELHEIESQFYLKAFYENYKEKERKLLKLFGYEDMIPIKYLYKNIQDRLPENDDIDEVMFSLKDN